MLYMEAPHSIRRLDAPDGTGLMPESPLADVLVFGASVRERYARRSAAISAVPRHISDTRSDQNVRTERAATNPSRVAHRITRSRAQNDAPTRSRSGYRSANRELVAGGLAPSRPCTDRAFGAAGSETPGRDFHFETRQRPTGID
jgi:hypothetical protein